MCLCAQASIITTTRLPTILLHFIHAVYEFCKHHQDGHHFYVHHGQKFIKHETCERCLCNNGSATSCQQDHQLHCRFLHDGATPQSCTHVHKHGRDTIHHGQKMKVYTHTHLLARIHVWNYTMKDKRMWHLWWLGSDWWWLSMMIYIYSHHVTTHIFYNFSSCMPTIIICCGFEQPTWQLMQGSWLSQLYVSSIYSVK